MKRGRLGIKTWIMIGCILVVLADSAEDLFMGMNQYYDLHVRTMSSHTDRQDYVSAARIWRELHVQGRDEAEEVKPLCAVAEYFEAASLYQAYKESGDTERADIQWQRMEDAAGRMGEYSGERAEINAKLGITE